MTFAGGDMTFRHQSETWCRNWRQCMRCCALSYRA